MSLRTITKRKRENHTGIVTEDNWFQGVIESEVASSVDDDSYAGDDKASVETDDSIRLEGLLVNIHETVELALSSLLSALGIVGETGSGVIERIDEEKRHGSSGTTRGDVLAELDAVAVGLVHLKHLLDFILEGKVERLGGEVPDAVGKVTAPEWDKT